MATSILSDLNAGTPVTTPGAAPTPASQTSPEVPEQVSLVIRGLSSGQIPGAYMPKGAQPIESGLKPDDLHSAGIAIYRPHDANVVAVAFNPKKISEKSLKAMDKAGTITENFPNMVELLQGAPSSPVDDLTSGTTPDTSDAARTSQILPKPTPSAYRGAGAPPITPSKRLVPGGGTVLNGLLARA